ncbi:polysaccharide ABC transporter ATP-binding protein [Ramlibacter sp. XY19]|uniref:ABC transporter ATP-binding protein n=1 Tax=Ramlibacter paludis TaxID=2908000 RepID=UPI0023D9DC76|nr:polysaccharide ABC transporter ATP-binding protein [Ramlibacter paludis]MCG2591237.1 polysaccharide ABC transporter ATP-binding protein [Ramlibacter paludis]
MNLPMSSEISPVVIRVRGVTKAYRLYNSKADRAAELFLPFGRKRHHLHYAVRDVDFDVAKGESIGIIGRNGSGKSTLLKIISGVLTATAGEVSLQGRLASLLELGAGFNPELTGRENVYFQGALMGLSSAEMEMRVAEILTFADIGEFIDQPVKTYSSGMFVRLAFSVSIHVDPEVLIVDEALAVGDVRFQKKCVDWMRRFQQRGGTVLFVSHDIYTVKAFCNRLILINNGVVEAMGDPDTVASRYYQIMFPNASSSVTVAGDEMVALQSEVEAGAAGETEVEIEADASAAIDVPDQDDKDRYWFEPDMSDKQLQWGSGAAWVARLRVAGVRDPNLFDWNDEIIFDVVVRWDREAVMQLCAEYHLQPNLLVGFRLENSKGFVITNFTNGLLEGKGFDIAASEADECRIQCRVAPLQLAAGNYFLTPGLAIGVIDHLHPVMEYTNLVHLLCDTSRQVMGQMRLDYDITLKAAMPVESSVVPA